MLLGQRHDVVVLGPRASVGLVAPIFEIALGMNLDVLPWERLANPLKAGVGHYLQLLRALALLYLLVQKRVHAGRASEAVVIVNLRIRRELQRWPR